MPQLHAHVTLTPPAPGSSCWAPGVIWRLNVRTWLRGPVVPGAGLKSAPTSYSVSPDPIPSAPAGGTLAEKTPLAHPASCPGDLGGGGKGRGAVPGH